MGFLSKDESESILLALNVLATAATGWVLYFVFQTSRIIVKGSVGGAAEDVLCPCIFKNRLSALQLTMGFTVASVTFFFLENAIAVLYRILFFVTCEGCAVRVTLEHTLSICLVSAYTLMFVTHFERLRLTFNDTSMELPKWAPNVLYAIASTGVVLFVVNVVFQTIDRIVSAVCLVLLLLLYFACIAALEHAFFKNTMAIANNAQHGSALVETAVRITVVVTVSLLSSTFSMFMWVVFLVICPRCLFIFGYALLAVDTCLNAFCLMCSFRRAQKHYKRLFGPLHRLVLAWATAKPSAEEAAVEAVMSVTSVSAQSKEPLP